MKYNVSFKLDLRKNDEGVWIENKVPLNAKITFAGDRLNYFTGFRIDVKNWQQGDIKKPLPGDQSARKNTKAFEGKREVLYSEVNRRLKNIDAALTILFDNVQVPPDKIDIVRALDKASKKSDIAEVPRKIVPLLFLPMFATYIENSRLSLERKKHAVSTMNHWQRFADKKKLTLTFDLVTPDLLRAFEKFLLSEKKVVKEKKVAARGLNTLHTIFAITRTFFNHTMKELKLQGIILQYPFESYTVPAEVYGTPVYLTLNERNTLFEAKIESERLAQVRDIFVFQCLTGARIGDMIKWNKSHVNNNVLSYIPRKTKEGKPVTVTVPLTLKATEILSRYDMPDNRLMPFISEQKYNDYIKELFEVVGLVRIVTRQHPTTREAENVRLCDIASSHMARRTFVGGLFGKIDSAVISSMSGHVANSKAFARYYDVSKELQRSAIDLIE